MSHRAAVLVSLCLVVALLAGPAAAATRDPRFEVYVADPVLEPGGEVLVEVQLVNDARDADDDVHTARQVVATLGAGDAPVTVRSGPRLLGDLADGQGTTVQFRLVVPRDAAPGTYDLPLVLDYEFDDEAERTTVAVRLTVEAVARFAATDASTTATIGETGRLTLTLVNVGGAPARAATVVVESTDPELAFGAGAPTAESFVGPWAPDEERQVVYTLRVGDSAIARDYTLRTVVRYQDEAGRDRTDAFAVGVTPRPARTFEVRDVEASLAIGSTGTVEATVANAGAEPIRDAVVRLVVEGTTLAPRAVEVPVGDLAGGATADVAFTVDVPDEAAPGPRRLGLVVGYENADGDRFEADPLALDVEVTDRAQSFGVEATRNRFTVDATDTLVVTITNDRAERVTDVTASLSVAAPLESADASVFVGTLEPGASARVAFEVEVTDDAIAKSYPAAVDVSYRDAAGTLRDSGPYRVGVEVAEPEEGDLPVLPALAILLAVGAGAVWWYRRR